MQQRSEMEDSQLGRHEEVVESTAAPSLQKNQAASDTEEESPAALPDDKTKDQKVRVSVIENEGLQKDQVQQPVSPDPGAPSQTITDEHLETTIDATQSSTPTYHRLVEAKYQMKETRAAAPDTLPAAGGNQGNTSAGHGYQRAALLYKNQVYCVEDQSLHNTEGLAADDTLPATPILEATDDDPASETPDLDVPDNTSTTKMPTTSHMRHVDLANAPVVFASSVPVEDDTAEVLRLRRQVVQSENAKKCYLMIALSVVMLAVGGGLAAIFLRREHATTPTCAPTRVDDTELNYDTIFTTTLPTCLGLLTQLTKLRLSEKQLRGTIPTELGLLVNLNALWLNANGLTGTIPRELKQLKTLTILQLYDNRLSGSLPSEMGLMTSLRAVNMKTNQFSGPLPTELGALTALTRLDLYQNQLNGTLPTELGQMTFLHRLDLYENALSGPVPTQMGQLSALVLLNLYRNRLNGMIPIEIGHLKSLQVLGLSENNLNGRIPSQVGLLTKLTQLSLCDNKLTGTIPVELMSLTDSLQELCLRNNWLTGPIPLWVGNISVAELQGNNFTTQNGL